MNQCPIDFSQRLFWLASTILGLLLLWRGSRQRPIKPLLCGLWGKISGKQSFRRVFENLPDPTWIISDNHFVEANPAALKAIGCEARSGLLYYHPSELSPELQPDGESSFIKANRIMDEARKQGYQRFDWLHKKLDGTLFPVEVTIATIQWAGSRPFYVAGGIYPNDWIYWHRYRPVKPSFARFSKKALMPSC